MKTQKRLDMLKFMANNEITARKAQLLIYLGEKSLATTQDIADECNCSNQQVTNEIKNTYKKKWIMMHPVKLEGYKGRKVKQYKLQKEGEQICMKLLGITQDR